MQGLYATLGAAAMLSGSGRVALFISAVMVEITNDTEFIPPLVLATFVAAIVGNRFNRASRLRAIVPRRARNVLSSRRRRRVGLPNDDASPRLGAVSRHATPRSAHAHAPAVN